MKKFAMGLVVSLTLLAGCQSDPSLYLSSSPMADACSSFQNVQKDFFPPNPANPRIHKHAATRVSVQMGEAVQDYFSEDDHLIFTQQMEFLSLLIPDRPDVAASVEALLKAHQNAAQNQADQLYERANSFYHFWIEDSVLANRKFYGFSFFVADTVSRLDERILSMTTHESSYTGGPHPENRQYSQSFDLQTGKALSLSDVLVPKGENWLKKECLRWFQDHAPEFGIEEPLYRDILEEKFSVSDSITDCFWSFSPSGMVFSFNPDEVAPHAAGIIKIELPYSSLEGILLSDYFPMDWDGGESGFFVQLGDTPAEGTFETTEFVMLHDQNQKVLSIYGDSLIPVPQVSVSIAQKFGEQVLVQRVLYEANYLSAENQLCIFLNPETDLENLCIQYQMEEGKTETVFFPPDTEFLHYQP